MNTSAVYTSKAEKYARYRWDYAPLAIQTVFEAARLSADSRVADIGAGTGILTRHFVGRVGRVFAVEPNHAMRHELRQMLERELGADPACTIVAGSAEDTELPDGCADLITVAQAIHWFDPQPARREFLRILKPGGWLAILRNYGTDAALNAATAALSTQENAVDVSRHIVPPEHMPMRYYFGHDDFRTLTFPFSFPQGWDEFIGSLCSASFTPDEDSPFFAAYQAAAREVFERFSAGGRLQVQGETELVIGRPEIAH